MPAKDHYEFIECQGQVVIYDKGYWPSTMRVELKREHALKTAIEILQQIESSDKDFVQFFLAGSLKKLPDEEMDQG